MAVICLSLPLQLCRAGAAAVLPAENHNSGGKAPHQQCPGQPGGGCGFTALTQWGLVQKTFVIVLLCRSAGNCCCITSHAH